MKTPTKDNVGQIYCKVQDYVRNKAGDLVVYGWASQDNIDSGKEIVPLSAINASLKSYSDFSNIRQMHNPFLGGAGICTVMIMEDSGLWIEAAIIDKEVQEKIIKKVYKGFSIGYIINGEYKRSDGINVLSDIELVEISVVDRPMNKKCLLEHINKVHEENAKGGTQMAKVLSTEDKEKMPDESFAFVGEIEGKSSRLFPYKSEGGEIDVELALASINILNSNRPEDVKFLTEEQKRASYELLSKAVSDSDTDEDIPPLVVDKDFGNKFANPENINEGKEHAEQIDQAIREAIDKGNESLFGQFKSFFATAFKRTPDGKNQNGKVIEVEVPLTSIDGYNDLNELRWKLTDVSWILGRVLENVLYSDALSSEEKEIRAIQAFNDAKAQWTDLFRQVVALTTSTKTVKPTQNKEDSVEVKSIMVDGVKFVPESGDSPKDNPAPASEPKPVTDPAPAPAPSEPETTEEKGNDTPTPEPEQKPEEPIVPEQQKALEAENAKLKAELARVKEIAPSAVKLAEQSDEKAVTATNPEDSSFWI